MKTKIFVPKKINVGFQNRSDTYTGKLAYVIYYDEKGKLRKEASWNSWRDDKIPNVEYDNEPVDGFVLNKKVGDYDSGWNHRHAYCRVYDPRGFEFEITFENLLYILCHATSTKGKGLEGEFVYGWDGKDLVLLPVESPDYKEIKSYTERVLNNECIKAKELVPGRTYLGKDNNEYVYMGRFDKWGRVYEIDGKQFKTYRQMKKYCDENRISIRNLNTRKNNYKYVSGLLGKQYCFQTKIPWNGFEWRTSLGQMLIGVVDEGCHPEYPNMYEKLQATADFSPVDDSKDEYVEMAWEEFEEYANNEYWYIDFFSNKIGKIQKYSCRKETSPHDGFILYNIESYRYENLELFPTHDDLYRTSMIPVSLKEIFDVMKPMYKQKYLTNGRKYEREYS